MKKSGRSKFQKNRDDFIFANVAEMVNAPVLKIGCQKWLVGSNPTVSVNQSKKGDVCFMVITYSGIIFYHLVEWIGIVTKSSEAVKDNKNMLAFTYLAIPSRHEVPIKPATEKAMFYE